MKICYFHGLGGSENESNVYQKLKANFKDITVLSPEVPHNLKEAYQWINEYLKCENPDMVVASSMGGFIVLSNDAKIPTLVINPAMAGYDNMIKAFGLGYKSDFHGKRKNGEKHFVLDEIYFRDLKEVTDIYNEKLKKGPDAKDYVFGIFSDNDEYFHNMDLFMKYYGNNAILIHDTHSISDDGIYQYVIPYVEKVLYNKK